ncbi:DUF6482 family protein [Paraglaciecola chathamensis]|jgi:carbamoylphosphate synthase small subunit|uniref:Na(+)-translocating NADH-quinone reductase subunit B n=2 Tax=Paraglaciecola chathamensis TaxID=368405 RepID=A0ABS0WDX2_9ALTE|nr:MULTISPECIES: DUF6482 family protein [Paraglaciecola]AEE25154.1 hypothetical protein Glaag_4231 [Glaciecola sp. 4H-3-7+YE-5]MBN27710.1 Na(+)-translocating NADH-quinone reductase subunit B [Alteromonadaceae bacterium]MBJ2136665.1 Na(+)-translocating NADH-quinone reductase subunit B [Paraglaciecola chathamensis]MBU3017710.1 Na(+)-translocating NADH-quinone reductase subunit B [Paraglaciecola agarilytica]GAC09781.1 hypothetical protein GCHA_1830 [Paraglaciecola chathamensis S18K6]|tara:strand:+ start:30088 stop:30396 length:309 start_codon:yes stop_codon:yes gene_type:complete
MFTYELQSVTTQKPDIEVVTVESHEMSLYILRLTIAGRQGVVFDKQTKRPAVFRSTEHIREVLSECNVAYAELIHLSPYDEMIGNGKSERAMVLPLFISPIE